MSVANDLVYVRDGDASEEYLRALFVYKLVAIDGDKIWALIVNDHA